MVVFGGSYGIGGDIAELAAAHGATVKTFSRSSTGTHVETRTDIAEAAAQVLAETGRIDFVVNTAGVLSRGELAETTEETIYSSTEVNYLAPIFIAQEFFPHLARVARVRCCCSPRRPTPAAGPATPSTPRPRRRWST